MATDGMPAKVLAQFLDVSLARVGQLAKEGVITKLPNGKYPNAAITQYIKFIRAKKEKSEGDTLSKEYLLAKTKYTQAQEKKLQRHLHTESGNLMRSDYFIEAVKSLLRHFKAQSNWIRKHRVGDDELLAAHVEMVKATIKECEKKGWVEGKNIDAL